MPLMTLTVQHGQTLDAARARLETAVHTITRQCGSLVSRVTWSTDHNQVRLEGSGGWIAMQVDAQAVHVSADLPGLGSLLGGAVTTGLKALIARTFQPTLPGGHGGA
jgi:hypothetical protein